MHTIIESLENLKLRGIKVRIYNVENCADYKSALNSVNNVLLSLSDTDKALFGRNIQFDSFNEETIVVAIAEHSNNPVGFMMFSRWKRDELDKFEYDKNIADKIHWEYAFVGTCVHPLFRRSRIPKILLEKSISMLKSKGIAILGWQCDPNNDSSILAANSMKFKATIIENHTLVLLRHLEN